MLLEPTIRHADSSRTSQLYGATGLAGLVVLLVASVGALNVCAVTFYAPEEASKSFSPYVDTGGNISLPEDFETTFVHIGTVSVEKSAEESVAELHSTYTRKQDVTAFHRDGKFPDGAILVKSVRAATNEKLSTGAASYGADIKVWFVMVKDSTGRFPDNELWGDGWGWALFDGTDRTKQIAEDYRVECRSCHVPAKQTDWTYSRCYPALTKAAPHSEPTSQEQSGTNPASEDENKK